MCLTAFDGLLQTVQLEFYKAPHTNSLFPRGAGCAPSACGKMHLIAPLGPALAKHQPPARKDLGGATAAPEVGTWLGTLHPPSGVLRTEDNAGLHPRNKETPGFRFPV